MPTTILTFGASEVQARFKAPFLTQEINRKFVASEAPGIYRGFVLGTDLNPLTISVSADAVFGDSTAAIPTSTGVNISVRRTGDFVLDLSAYASKTVALALVADYALGSDTSVRLQAFEVSPTDEFTGAGIELVVLGQVTVPAAGVIPASNISVTGRTDAWTNRSAGEIPFRPFLRNGGFEYAITGASTATETRIAEDWFASATDSYVWQITETATHTGLRSVELVAPGPLTTTVDLALLRQLLNVPVTDQRMVRLEAYVQQPTLVTVGGAFRFQLRWVDKDGSDIVTTSEDFSPLGVSSSFERITAQVIAPANAVLLRELEFQIDDVQVGFSGVVFRVDNLQAYVQPLTSTDDPRQNAWARALHAGPLVLRDPEGDFAQDGAQFEVDDSDPNEVRVALDQIRDLLGSKARGPALDLNRIILGANLLSTAALAKIPRVESQYSATVGATLINEVSRVQANGAGFRTTVFDNGDVYFTINAAIDTGGNWVKDASGDTSVALVLQNGGELRYLRHTAGGASFVSWDTPIPLAVGGSSLNAFNTAQFTSLVAQLGTGSEFLLTYAAQTLAVFTDALAINNVARTLDILGDSLEVDETNQTIGFFNSEFLFDIANRRFEFFQSAGGGGRLEAFNLDFIVDNDIKLASWFQVASISASGGFANMLLGDGRLSFPFAGANTNPAITAGFTNTLLGLNTPKAWGRFRGGAPGSVEEGFNIQSFATTTVNLSGPVAVPVVQLKMANGFSAADDYMVIAIPRLTAFGNYSSSTVLQNCLVSHVDGTDFYVGLQQLNNSFLATSDTDFAFSFVVFGRQ